MSARLGGRVTLEAQANGQILACFDGYSVALGTFSAGAADRAQDLRIGLPLAAFVSSRRTIDKEISLLVRRLAGLGLLEYRLLRARTDEEEVVIEPQVAEYWPAMPQLDDADVLVLSRFAYMRRRGNDMVLESPRAGALFKLRDPTIATAIAALSTPRQIKRLRRQDGFPGLELLALLVDCQILLKIEAALASEASGQRGHSKVRAPDTRPKPSSSARAALASEASGQRGHSKVQPAEGDDNLALWDFHDLLFHARSTQGRHANPLGGVYPHAGVVPPLPAVRPRWPGKRIDLRTFSAAHSQPISPLAKLLRERHSTRSFDDRRPITLAELSRFLDGTARVLSSSRSRVDLGDGGPSVAYTVRPYPSAGGSYELELYLAVDACEGLARGFYHYDAGGHALVPIGARAQELEALLRGAEFAMGAPAAPQILITLAARFGRMSWKYSSLAYALILKDVGVLTQTLYLMATDMGLGGCAIGTADIDLFAKMTGIEFHVEGPVGQFALGRGSKSGT